MVWKIFIESLMVKKNMVSLVHGFKKRQLVFKKWSCWFGKLFLVVRRNVHEVLNNVYELWYFEIIFNVLKMYTGAKDINKIRNTLINLNNCSRVSKMLTRSKKVRSFKILFTMVKKYSRVEKLFMVVQTSVHGTKM